MSIWHFILPGLAVLAVIAVWRMRGGRVKRRLEVPESGWHTGPIIGGKSWSHGVKLEITPTGFKVTLGPGDELDAVLRRCDALPDPFTVRYRVDGDFRAVEAPEPHLTLFFQRRGDDWSKAQADYEWKRWYSTLFPLTPGEHMVSVPMEVRHWKGVNTPPAPHEQHFFDEAVSDPFLMGFAFGGRGGRMHGIVGTGTIEFFTGD